MWALTHNNKTCKIQRRKNCLKKMKQLVTFSSIDGDTETNYTDFTSWNIFKHDHKRNQAFSFIKLIATIQYRMVSTMLNTNAHVDILHIMIISLISFLFISQYCFYITFQYTRQALNLLCYNYYISFYQTHHHLLTPYFDFINLSFSPKSLQQF